MGIYFLIMGISLIGFGGGLVYYAGTKTPEKQQTFWGGLPNGEYKNRYDYANNEIRLEDSNGVVQATFKRIEKQ